MTRKHINIPVFVPHLGCPHDCVFCNQRKITGHDDFSIEDAEKAIEEVVCDPRNEGIDAEIAFFGGSFTGIDRGLMESLLGLAEKYVRLGKVSGIRLSTRPDYIDAEIISILSRYTVKTVELGIQSISDEVLKRSERGHTAQDSFRAMKLVKEAGFSLIGQMMLGLPSSDLEKEKETLEAIHSSGADGIRIYPTAVFYGTRLHEMMLSGEYTPLSPEEAVERSAELLYLANRYGLKVIRVGLCETDSLHSENGIAAGAFHPALGEMCMSALYFKLICEKLDSFPEEKSDRTIVISVAKGALSKAIGQKKINIVRLREKYSPAYLKISGSEELSGYGISISID